MELFVLGDSVSQGFMSGAAARTDLAYPTLIARAMGLSEEEHRVADYPAGGLFFPLEEVLRRLTEKFGADINAVEWPAAIKVINDVVDESEDYYERGPGAARKPDPSGAQFFHNVASYGFRVADSWLLRPQECLDKIEAGRPQRFFGEDGFMAVASNSFYRSALKVLSPARDLETRNFTQMDWLRHHARKPDGIHNVIAWLGGNNVLPTILKLHPMNSPARLDDSLNSHDAREAQGWTIWHPKAFEQDYRTFLEHIDAAMAKNNNNDWRVFVATIPYLTILPLAKGVGPARSFNILNAKGQPSYYYKYYTYFPFEEDYVREGGQHLTREEVILVDEIIEEYNISIRKLVREFNDSHKAEGLTFDRYHVVPIAALLRGLAYKRNGGRPYYPFPEEIRYRFPRINTKYYHADPSGRLRQGGVFGIDGVHPTAIGHGLLAHEFLKAMGTAGVRDARGRRVEERRLDWNAIYAGDALYQEPIKLMQELYQHRKLTAFLVDALRNLI